MDSTKNFGENSMNLNMNNNNQFIMNNQIGFNNNQMLNQNFIQNPMINQYNTSFYNNNPNMFQNNNNMILNNQMMNMMNFMNMNQMMMNMMINMNQMNQNDNNNNNNVNDDNIYNLDKDKLNLMNSIIEFYKKNNMDCMNFGYPNQIKPILNLLNENHPGFKYENSVEDPLFYINEPKILIRFINSNYIVKKVKILKSNTQYDLYTIADLYKLHHYSNILLIHKNKILNKDESSIDFISDNDNIIIIEPIYFPDNTYYNSLMKKSLKDAYNVILLLQNGIKFNKVFPSDITIGEVCKAFYLIHGLSNNHYFILDNDMGKRISLKDKRKLKEFCAPIYFEEIYPDNIGYHIKILGKKINFTLYSNDKKLFSYVIGLLNKIEDIIKYSEPIEGRLVKKIIIGEIEINKDEEKRLCSLLSLGITKDFDCFVEFGENLDFNNYKF